MDPEERLWFLEQAVVAYFAQPIDRGDLAFGDPSDGHQYVWLIDRNGAVHVEVGARECFAQRPLSAQAVCRLHELGFQRSRISGDFFKEGLEPKPPQLSQLVEQLFLFAYEPRLDFAVRASFKNEAASRRLRSIVLVAASRY
jgi:hypothetical protein